MASAPKSPRHGRKLTRHEIERFLKVLSETGNVTLAAARVGRHRSTFVKRRGRDPAFAARCGMAVARFRLDSSAPKFSGKGAPALKHAPGELVLTHGRKRPAQVRRAAGGELTQSGIDAFLHALAATANLRLAAESVGVWPNAIRQRRRRDAAFDRAVREALLLGYGRLEAALVESACRALQDPDPEYDNWLEANGGAELPKMSIDQAFMLLVQHRRTCQLGWDNKRVPAEISSIEDARTRLERAMRSAGLLSGDEG